MADTTDPAVVEFRMPSLGSDMESGTVIAWRVAEGDAVSKGDVLLDVDTDKSDIEVEVWRDARVDRILVGPGETVAVGTPIARLAVGTPPAASNAPQVSAAEPDADTRDLGVTDGATDGPGTAEPLQPVEPPHDVAAPTTRTRPGIAPSPLVTPRMVYWPASESVSGSASAVPARPPSPSQPSDAGSEARPARRQNVVALAMEQSNREIPHFHLTSEIDLEHTMAWLEAANAERRPPDRILPAALFLRAVALTVRRHPTFNGAWVDGGYVGADSIQLGIAIHMRDGTLMTPVLPDADRLRLDELMASFRALVGRVRSGGLRSTDIALPTITVTNLGDTGADSVAGLIRPPQVALVGFGRVRPRPVAVDGGIEVRRTVLTTLSADHRANNGQAAAAFLTTLADLTRSPEEF